MSVPTRASIQKALADEQRIVDQGPPESCKINRRGYLEYHAFAQAEAEAGRRQKRCARCDRWKFPSERCELFRRKRGA